MSFAASFKTLGGSTAADWAIISSPANVAAEATLLPERMLAFLAMQAGQPSFGWPVNVFDHCLQTATRAMRAGADEETIVCALFHDATEFLDLTDHGASIAALLAPYVSPDNAWMISNHAEFQDRHITTHPSRGGDSYLRHRDHPAFERTPRFTTEWDQTAFDPDYKNEPLEAFAPFVRSVFGKAEQ